MLEMAFELIGEATSNSLLMFCFCNIIIVIILRGSKPVFFVEQGMAFSASHGCNICNHARDDIIIAMNATPSSPDDDESHESRESSIDVPRVLEKHEETAEIDEEIVGHCDDGDNEDQKEHEEEEEEEEDYDDDDDDDDDELRKRVEEFIAKVNEEWKNEKLRSLKNLAFT